MSTSGSSEGANVNRTVRVTRPRKIAKALVHQAVFSPQGADLSTASPDYKREGKWEIWNKSSKPRSASPEKDRRRDDRWSDPGRDTKEWGPVSSVKERPARQPKPQTNWFNPKDTGDEPESGSRKGRRGDRAGISDPVTTTTGPVEKPKDRWRSREVKPSTSTWEKRDKADKRAQKQERNWSPSPQVERRPDPKPKRTWTPPPKADTQPEKQERSWSPSPKVERRPAPPKRTWSPPPKVERREEPRKTYSPPPKREEPKREVKRSSSSSSRKKPSKNEPKKEEKKSTKNDDKKDREEKRKRSGRRRGK